MSIWSQVGDLLLRGGNGIVTGDEAARRRLLGGDRDERSRTPGGIAGLLAVLRLPELELSDDVRNLSHELHSGPLQYAGLAAALLRSIRELVRFAKGSVRIESQPEHGTKLLVRILLATVRSDVVAPAAS